MVVAIVSDMVFRLLVRPLMRRWYYPKCLDPTAVHPLLFQLGVGESILEERPARRVDGRTTTPGTLVRTNRRAYFFPFAWQRESWSIPYEHVADVRLVTPRRRALGWVSGYPDHVVVTEDSGETTALIVAEPAEVLSWFGILEEAPDDREGMLERSVETILDL